MAIYYNSIEGQFCYDDHFAIKNNKDATGEAPFWDLWSNDFWGQDISKADSHKSYRPITVLSFRLNYWLHRTLFDHPSDGHRRLLIQLHATNVLMHAIVSCQIYFVCQRFFSVKTENLCRLASFVGAIIFAAHPIHTEAVSGLVGRAEPLSALFSISAFQFFQAASEHGAFATGIWQLLGSVTLLILSILSKETSFPIIVAFVIWDVIQHLDSAHKWIVGRLPGRRLGSPLPTGLLKRIFCMVTLAAAYLVFRRVITVHFTVMNYRRVENPIAFAPQRLTRVLSMLHLHARYAWLLIFPHPLSADYSFNCLPLIESLSDYRNVFGFALYGALLIVCVLLGKNILSSSPGTNASIASRRVAFGVLWLVFPFLPTSNALVWVGTMLAERLLYLPSVGLCILVAAGAQTMMEHNPKSSLRILSICALVCAIFSAKTMERNQDWVDERRLFDSAERVCPDSAKVHYNQGIMAMDRKNFTQARFHFRRTREIEPMHCELDLQYGILAWEDKKDPNEAVKYFKLALGCIYTKVKAVENLHTIYQALTQIFPDNFFYVEQWADILRSLDREDDAYHHYVQCGIGFEQKHQRTSDSIRCFEQAVALKHEKAYLAHLWLATNKEKKINFAKTENDAIAEVLTHFWTVISHSEKYRPYALSGAVGILSKLNQEQRSTFAAYIHQASELIKEVDLSTLQRDPDFVGR
eukprot:TRINITY_DN352_c0_g1_i1.p1 TRINITY_DN352_c0_g1~~TRINITY_DN352_c0_g1_i1.p1  ORF type:complete len:772 (+),score=74.37 TRINITY_DN352_c0_g1_i1:229-2316(+)